MSGLINTNTTLLDIENIDQNYFLNTSSSRFSSSSTSSFQDNLLKLLFLVFLMSAKTILLPFMNFLEQLSTYQVYLYPKLYQSLLQH